jgi:hypothetical protein
MRFSGTRATRTAGARCWSRRLVVFAHALAMTFAASAAVFADTAPPEVAGPQVPDPSAAISMLGDATADEKPPAAPFVALATQLSVDPLFGTATTTIPIELPPGRKMMTPDLTIRYSSNGSNGVLGLGWDLPLGCIKRNTTQGVPLNYVSGTYADAMGFVLMFNGGTVVLDSCPGGDAQCKCGGSSCTTWAASSEEQWLSATQNRNSNSWTIVDRNGVTYTYGGDPKARTGPSVYSSSAFATTSS